MKRSLCLFLASVLLVVAVLSSSAFTLQGSRTYQSADSSGAYVISFSGSHADVTRYASDAISIGLNVSYKISGVCAYHEKVVLICDDSNNNQLIVYIYYLDSDVLDSFAIYGARLNNDSDFCCDDNAIYIENYRDNRELTAYSYSGNLIKRYRFDQRSDALCSGYDSGVYAVSDNTLYRLYGGGFTAVSGEDVDPPLSPAASDVIVSDYGVVYVLNGSRITRTFPVDSRFGAASACVIGDRLYCPDGSVINGYDITNGDKESSCRLNFDASLVYADGGSLIAVVSNTYTSVSPGDLIELTQPDDQVSSGSGSGSSAGSSEKNNNAGGAELSDISSDVYRVDYSRYYISGISPETTVYQFKNNMHYNGWTVSLYRDGALKTSGYVGTANTAVFVSGSNSVTFELSVNGDLTGEGNSNSRDVCTLLDYLIGAADFNGVYLSAADLSGDGTVNAVDAALLKRIG